MSSLSDSELVAAIAAGDREALARLYDLYGGVLFAIGLRMLHDRQHAEDLVHDVFLEAWAAAHTFSPTRGNVRTWLILRTRSRALDLIRSPRRARSVPFEAVEAPTLAADPDPLDVDGATVRRALAELSNEQRATLELCYFEGLSSPEIAERLGLPLGTVKSRIAAALQRLRTLLNAPGQVRAR